jgi:hypothetical protein
LPSRPQTHNPFFEQSFYLVRSFADLAPLLRLQLSDTTKHSGEFSLTPQKA